MCGIAGILSTDPKNVSRQRLQKMTDSLHHRGPEGDGFWLNHEGTAGLGHRRLSIIDLSEAAAQPMHYLDRYTITYNGEIFNYIEIKDDLVKKGFTFTSHCDTEVVLAAYACYGRECLQYFDGMFAFAIWDNKENNLFCARDRFGEKPFYYYYSHSQNQFVFASEMKALWAAGIHKKIDSEMLLNYLTLGWVQNPVNKQQTFFEDIICLPPSHYLLYKLQHDNNPYFEVRSYWDIDKETQIADCTGDAIKQQFQTLFTTSVKRRLRSDVAIGSSLSGGLDSSAIVAVMNSLLEGSKSQKTFSAIFPGFERDESKHIQLVVDQFKIDNYTVTPTADDFINDFEKLIWHQEEPFQSSSIFAQYKVYELAKQKGVTVILDGQGADETMAGYTKYYHWYWQEIIANHKWKEAKREMRFARQHGQKINWSWKNYVAAFSPQLAANEIQRRSFKQQATHPDITIDFFTHNYNKSKIYKPAVTKLNDILYYNTMHIGLEELLRYADRNSMAHSREVRLPFLSHELVQFVFSLPSSCKIFNGYTKQLLRISMESFLPASIVWRKDKVGFEPPQKQWMQDAKVEEYIFESRKKLVKAGILKPEVLQQAVRHQSAHEAGNFDWRYLCAAQCL
ncbi:MAG: asnB [Segetibacter sp.]|nr:asnB [Segetibacter sp.]